MPKPVAKDFFIYRTFHEAIGPGETNTQNIRIQADSDFMLQKLSQFSDVAGAAQTVDTQVIPLCTVLITDSGSGRNLMEDDVPIPALYGNGLLPFILPTQKIFARQSIITVRITNFSAATTYDVRLNFIGQKLFYSGQN